MIARDEADKAYQKQSAVRSTNYSLFRYNNQDLMCFFLPPESSMEVHRRPFHPEPAGFLTCARRAEVAWRCTQAACKRASNAHKVVFPGTVASIARPHSSHVENQLMLLLSHP